MKRTHSHDLQPDIITATELENKTLAHERRLIERLEAGAKVEAGPLSVRIVTGIYRGRTRKRLLILNNGRPTRSLAQLFDGGLLQ